MTVKQRKSEDLTAEANKSGIFFSQSISHSGILFAEQRVTAMH